MTALELTPEAKMIVERVQKEGGEGAQVRTRTRWPCRSRPSGRKAPTRRAGPVRVLRPPPASRSRDAAAGAPGAVRNRRGALRPVPLELKGIVSFPDGFLAIVNNQIVKVGDTVSGHRVERITETSVTLTEPGASPRTINLPELAPAPAAAPKR